MGVRIVTSGYRELYFGDGDLDAPEEYAKHPAVPDPAGYFGIRHRHQAWIRTGAHTAPVRVHTRVRDHEPGPLEDGWDVAVEVTFWARNGRLVVESWSFVSAEPPENLASAGEGWYRIRAHARGRDRMWDLEYAQNLPHPVTDPEEHLHIAWPVAAWEPARLLVGPDRVGQQRIQHGNI